MYTETSAVFFVVRRRTVSKALCRFVAYRRGKRMKIGNRIFETKCTDRNRITKTLYVNANLPKVNETGDGVREGYITLRSLSMAGVILNSGEIADLISTLARAREKMLERELKLDEELGNKGEEN